MFRYEVKGGPCLQLLPKVSTYEKEVQDCIKSFRVRLINLLILDVLRVLRGRHFTMAENPSLGIDIDPRSEAAVFYAAASKSGIGLCVFFDEYR